MQLYFKIISRGQNYFKGAKLWWLFDQLYQNSTDCFVLEVSTVSRFQNGICIELFQKNPNREVEDFIFWKRSLEVLICPSFNLPRVKPLEIPDKMKLHPWKFYKIVLHPLKFPRLKTKTHGNSTFFYNNPNNPKSSLSSNLPCLTCSVQVRRKIIWLYYIYIYTHTHTHIYIYIHIQGFAWSSIFWVFKLSRVNCIYEFPQFPTQVLSKIPQKYF